MRDTKGLALAIRKHAVEMTSRGNSSHVGSVLSMADILAVLYGKVLRVKPSNPAWPDRDRVILSKGHAGAGIYASLAELGFFPKSKLESHYQNGSDLSGHVSHKGVPGVEISTGSLGHGLPIATGIAKAATLKNKNFQVFCIMGDGECDEGSTWEAALFASHHKLANLTVIVDYNKLQSLTTCAETLALEPFADKWNSFGWETRETDGHDHDKLHEALTQGSDNSRPRCVLAHTVKGKGVSFMENSVLWHYRSPQGEEFDRAIAELLGKGTVGYA